MITVSQTAASKIRELMDAQGKPNYGLRVRIVAGGCSGLQYKLDLSQNPKPNDNVFESNGIKLFVDPKSAIFLEGTEVDYKLGLMERGFKVNNPNAKTACSCGESFTA